MLSLTALPQTSWCVLSPDILVRVVTHSHCPRHPGACCHSQPLSQTSWCVLSLTATASDILVRVVTHSHCPRHPGACCHSQPLPQTSWCVLSLTATASDILVRVVTHSHCLRHPGACCHSQPLPQTSWCVHPGVCCRIHIIENTACNARPLQSRIRPGVTVIENFKVLLISCMADTLKYPESGRYQKHLIW